MCEGSYPYYSGGVSSWVHMLINEMKDVEFCISAIVVDREHGGKFKYPMPPNLTSINEIYLMDSDFVREKKKQRLTTLQKEAFRSFVMGKDVNWNEIFNFFGQGDISVNGLLMGNDIYDIIYEFYRENYDRLPFTDFLWTYRSMMLPICLLLKNELPKADIYHSASAGYSGVLACMAKHLYKKPTIMTEHGIYTREREEDIIKSPDFNGLYKDIWIEHFYKLSSCAYKNCDQVISLFEGAREIQIELGCDPNKTRVIPNGVDETKFESIPQKTDDSEINLGIVARVTPIKDIKTLINAYAAAVERVPNITLYIMGGADQDYEDYFEECQELARNLHLNRVKFTGNINVPDYIGKMDIIILTSISEGQPFSLLEAMASGKPCIATRVGCCEELLYGKRSGAPHCGIITPIMSVAHISSAIVDLATNPEKRKAFGETARQRVLDEYRKENLISVYKNLYAKMLSNNLAKNGRETKYNGGNRI